MDQRIAALLRKGEGAALAGQEALARRVFRSILSRDPQNLAALLWMAWLSEDLRASHAYAERALALDPSNERARAARQWAQSRLDSSATPEASSSRARERKDDRRWRRFLPLAALGSLAAFAAGALLVILWFSPQQLPVMANVQVWPCPTPTSTSTPSPTRSATPTATATATPTPTPTPTTTDTPVPTSTGTPTQTPSQTPSPTSTSPPTSTVRTPESSPSPTSDPLSPTDSSTGGDVRWIDVDLSSQTLTAYAGNTPLRSTLISTGLPDTPTPIGKYHIYVKLRYDDMEGPDYNLRDVPYTMYFYRGYGIHGTYWHSSFGYPMSHGCINLPTDEAEWLFGWASVGTLVNIHW